MHSDAPPGNGTLAFARIDRGREHPMDCFGDAALTHSTAASKRDLTMTLRVPYSPGDSAVWLGALVLTKCPRASSKKCPWFRVEAALSINQDARTASLSLPAQPLARGDPPGGDAEVGVKAKAKAKVEVKKEL